tara:strand:- start:133 stop:342 length:210 start_codon:yes stop_codon:yes gene_type:complete
MKFILVIIICSSSLGICTNPQTMGQFDNWYECSNQGYSIAKDFNLSMGKDRVNKEKTIINFSCQEFDTI